MRLVVLTALVLSFSISAQAETCRDLLLKEFGLPPTRTAIGWRGYLGTSSKHPDSEEEKKKRERGPEATLENREKAERLGLMHWGQRIYVLPTKEAIVEHDKKQHNVLLKGVYLLGEIDPGIFVDEKKQIKGVELEEAFKQLVKKGMFWVKDGKVINVDTAAIKNRFDPKEVSVILEPEGQGNFFYQEGWFSPARRGVVFIETLMEGNKDIRSLARKLIDQGYTFSINRAFGESVHMLAVQKRSVRDPKTGERTFADELNNRFKNKEEQENLFTRFSRGTALSFEMWNPQGKLIAGSMVLKSGNVFYPDSVFYDVTYAKNIIDYVKVSILYFGAVLQKAGYSFFPSGMVSNMTDDLGGIEVERVVHDVLIDVLNNGEFKQLDPHWDGPEKRDSQ